MTARRAGTGARRPYRKHKQFSNSNSNSQFICCFPKLFRGGQLPSPSHICRPLCLHYARLIGRRMECLCARAFTCVGVCVRVSSLRRFRAIVCLCMCTPRAYVCFWLRVHFMMCTLFLFRVQESPSGPLGVPVPACQKRLHLLDPLEAGDSQMSLGPSTEWWEEDRKRRVGERGGRRREGGVCARGRTEVKEEVRRCVEWRAGLDNNRVFSCKYGRKLAYFTSQTAIGS